MGVLLAESQAVLRFPWHVTGVQEYIQLSGLSPLTDLLGFNHMSPTSISFDPSDVPKIPSEHHQWIARLGFGSLGSAWHSRDGIVT